MSQDEWEDDSFRWNLSHVNEKRPPSEPAPPPRFIHLEGTTADKLAEAIELALN